MEFQGLEQRVWYLKIERKPDHYFLRILPINEGRGPLPLKGYTGRLIGLDGVREFLDHIQPNGYHFDPEHSPILPMKPVPYGGLESALMISSGLADLDRRPEGYIAFVVLTRDERELQRRLEEWEVRATGDETVHGKFARSGLEAPAGRDPLPFGYPNFWDTARAAFSRFFEVVPRLYEGANSLSEATHASGDSFQEVMSQLERLTMMAMSELVIMVGNGHGVGALRITRSMLEYGINAKYLLQEPEARELFLNWHFVEQHKALLYMRRFGLDKNIDPEKIKDSEERYEQAKHFFTNKRGELRGYWSALDLGSRARAVGLEEIYEIVNPRATKIVHGTVSGLATQFSAAEDGKLRFVAPPSLENCGMALHYGHFSELLVLEVLAEIARADSSPSLRILNEDFEYAWKGESAPSGE